MSRFVGRLGPRMLLVLAILVVGLPGQTPAAAATATHAVIAAEAGSAAHASEFVSAPLWTATKHKTPAQNALRHFNDHGSDFPDVQNSLEYVAKAQDFLRSPMASTLTRVRSNGDVVRWHPGSNTFGVMDAGGAPRTLFKPDPTLHGKADNWEYFYAQ